MVDAAQRADGGPQASGVEDWFERVQIRPVIVGELGDSALLKAFGQEGPGVFAGAHGRERVYAVVMPSRIDNEAVRAVLSAASENVRLSHK